MTLELRVRRGRYGRYKFQCSSRAGSLLGEVNVSPVDSIDTRTRSERDAAALLQIQDLATNFANALVGEGAPVCVRLVYNHERNDTLPTSTRSSPSCLAR
jgi:hypothetical protein